MSPMSFSVPLNKQKAYLYQWKWFSFVEKLANFFQFGQMTKKKMIIVFLGRNHLEFTS